MLSNRFKHFIQVNNKVIREKFLSNKQKYIKFNTIKPHVFIPRPLSFVKPKSSKKEPERYPPENDMLLVFLITLSLYIYNTG